MFYKHHHTHPAREFIRAHPLEFALVLKEKTKDFPDFQTGYIVALEKETHQKKYIKPVFLNDRGYFSDGGIYLKNFSGYGKRNIISEFKLKNIEDVFIETCSLKEQPDKSAKEIIELFLSDFFNIMLQKEVQDKYGKTYDLKIVHNSDASIGDNLIVDEIFLYKNKERIGYLKAKYTTQEICQKINEELKNDVFLDEATVDYSFLDDNYKNKGLGYVMYFHMSQYLNSKGIKFRASSLQSNEARQLWAGIQKHWKNHIYKNKNSIFLDILPEMNLEFINQQPIIEKVCAMNDIEKNQTIYRPQFNQLELGDTVAVFVAGGDKRTGIIEDINEELKNGRPGITFKDKQDDLYWSYLDDIDCIIKKEVKKKIKP